MRLQDLSQKNRSSVTTGEKERLWKNFTNDDIHVLPRSVKTINLKCKLKVYGRNLFCVLLTNISISFQTYYLSKHMRSWYVISNKRPTKA